MKGIAVGEPAPSFRLPSALGREVGLDDFRGRKNTIVWFTKGMACPFCRAHMSQLARGYAEFQKLDAELLEISLSSPERAHFYASKFRLPFPYLCDPDYRVRRRWLLDDRSHNVAWYAMIWFYSLKLKPPASDFGGVNITPGEKLSAMYDDDSGFFVVDKHGIVRYRLAGSFVDYRAKRHGRSRATRRSSPSSSAANRAARPADSETARTSRRARHRPRSSAHRPAWACTSGRQPSPPTTR